MLSLVRCLVVLGGLVLLPSLASAETLSVRVTFTGEGSDPAKTALISVLKDQGFTIHSGKEDDDPPDITVAAELSATVVSERKYKGHIMFVAEAVIALQALRTESETLVMATSNAFKSAGRSAEEAKDRARESLTAYMKKTMAKEVADGIRDGY